MSSTYDLRAGDEVVLHDWEWTDGRWLVASNEYPMWLLGMLARVLWVQDDGIAWVRFVLDRRRRLWAFDARDLKLAPAKTKLVHRR